MLPSGLSQHADVQYALRGDRESENSELSQTQKRLLKLLQERGSLRGRQIDTHFRNVDWRKSAEWLVRRGFLEKKSVLPEPRVSSKLIKVVQLAVSPGEAEAAMPDLGKTEATQTRRAAALHSFATTSLDMLDSVLKHKRYAPGICCAGDYCWRAGLIGYALCEN